MADPAISAAWRARCADAVASGEPVLAGVLERAGLPVSGGCALYRYATSDTHFAALRTRLEILHKTGRLAQPNPASAAVFVLYVAEWFRREYEGGHYRWDSPLPGVIGELTASAIKNLARRGLAWWGLSPRRMAGGEMRLLSLVLEGGFPTRLLETRERGRIAVHLRTLIAQLEVRVDCDEETATTLSRTTGLGLGSYDHDEFHILCAELAQAVVALKRQAAGAPPGVSASAWLDVSQPHWREALPISLTGDSARRLLDDLVSGHAERMGGEAGCQRLLLHDGDKWVAGVTLEMRGEVTLPVAQLQPVEGRLHVFAARELASVYAGELGLLDPPAETGQRWLSRRRGGARDPIPFPLERAAEVELRSVEGWRSILTWPRGQPLRSEVLAFADPRGDDVETPPQTLVHLGGGSLSTRRRRLWLLTPPDFEVYPLDSDDREMPIWRGESHLYEINRSVHVGAQGLHGYRVEVGADSDHAHELAFDGPLLAGGEAEAGKVTIFAGVPHLRLRSGLQSRVPQVGSVFWRLWGASIWRDWVSEALDAEHDHGLVEVVWRDPKSRASLDRQRIVVVPAGAKITAQPMGEQGVAYALVNLDSWALEATSDRVAAVASPDGLEVVFNSRPLRRLALILSSNQVRLAILAPAPVAGGGFCSADGGLLDNGARVMLDELRGAVAFSAGLERLHLRGPYGSESHFTFNGELPLWAASEEIVRLLSASSGLDDVVTLELGLGGRRLKVGRYAATLMITSEGGISVVPDLAAAPTRRLDWLSVTTAQHRVLSDGFWADRLPHDLQGPGIIMARQAGRVVGRPTLAVGGTLPVEGLGGLQRATLISRGGQRRGVVSERLDTLNEDTVEAAADRDFLLAMITSLNGAPPAAIDALAMLPDHPTALASLAAAAETKDELGKVWLLERELPFLWAAVPLELWIGAFATRHKKLERLLTEHGFGAVDAAGLAGSTVASAVDALAGLDPMLRAGLALVVGATTSGNASLTLKDGVQDRLRRTAENFEGLGVLAAPLCSSRVATSCFRRPGSALVEQLPIFPFDDSFQEGLDAPCAVALAAAARLNAPRRIVLDAEQMRRARDARAREPQSFADIYTAALKLLARGAPLVL